MSTQIIIDLPEEVFSVFRSSPEDFGKQMRLAAATKWYEIGLVSQSKAAELAGASRQAFLRLFHDSKFRLCRKHLRNSPRYWVVTRRWVLNAFPLVLLAAASGGNQ